MSRKYQLHRSEQVLTNVHPKSKCKGRPCPIHNPSDHHMRDWPQIWRGDLGFMERLCEKHFCGHPDPDDPKAKGIFGVHGCCGCCIPPKPEPKHDLLKTL